MIKELILTFGKVEINYKHNFHDFQNFDFQELAITQTKSHFLGGSPYVDPPNHTILHKIYYQKNSKASF